jgi:hypothetical protein
MLTVIHPLGCLAVWTPHGIRLHLHLITAPSRACRVQSGQICHLTPYNGGTICDAPQLQRCDMSPAPM